MVHFYIFHFVVQQFSNFSREAFRYMIGIMTTSNYLVLCKEQIDPGELFFCEYKNSSGMFFLLIPKP